MDTSYLKVANGFGLWIIALLMVSVVVLQTVIFTRKAFKVGTQIGLSEQQLKSGFRTGLITSIGPSFAILIGMVGLVTLIGAPMAWMRLSVIGAVMFETLAASYGAEALGVNIGDPGYGLVGFANSLWVMALGSVGWLLIVGLFTHKLEDARQRIVRGKEYLLPVIGTGAILGAFGFQVSKSLVVLGPATVAAIMGGITMVVLNTLASKLNKSWIKEWSLGIAMLVGMFSAVIL